MLRVAETVLPREEDTNWLHNKNQWKRSHESEREYKRVWQGLERGREEREKYPIILKILDIHEKFKYICQREKMCLVLFHTAMMQGEMCDHHCYCRLYMGFLVKQPQHTHYAAFQKLERCGNRKFVWFWWIGTRADRGGVTELNGKYLCQHSA